MASLKFGVKYPFTEFKGVKTITAATTLTKEDSHKLIVIDTTTACAVTLPPTRADLKFTFLLKQLPGSGGHAISPNANDSIIFKGVATIADDKDLFFGTDAAGAGDVVGDTVTLAGDGSVGWYAIAGLGSFTRET
jgi:hypothetical protein